MIYQFQFFMCVSVKACHDCEKIMNNLWPFNLLAIFHLQTAMWVNNLKHKKVKTSDHHLNRELILLPYIYTHAQVIVKLVNSIMNSPVPKKLKGRFAVTEV